MAETKVTPEEIYLPSKFSVYRNASQGLTTNANTKINFDTEVWDTGSDFDNATNFRFVAPRDGFYHFSWEADITSTSGAVFITMLYKNGAEYKRGSRTTLAGAGTAGSTSSGQMQMSAGDYAEVYGYASAGTVTLGVGFVATTWFDGYRMSKT
jgi:hypothetical protein